ncbi:MAG TPA: hypothetical protein VHG91_18100, partial [Longimicrobium sp.]|nr:hypothetical protein [Longimicrobium sp.]
MAHWTTTAWTRRLPLALAAALACAAGAAFARPQPGVEDLGVMVEAATPEHRFLARLPSGETHLLLFFTRKSYATTPFQIVDVDLSTGRARTVEGVPGRPGTNATVLHSDGQLYVGTAQPGGWMRYDPATGRAEALGRLADNGAQHAVEGSDGALYVGQSGRATVQRFDPRAGRLETVGRADGGVAAGTRYAYTLGGDGRWVYVASGHAPWSLVVFDRARGTQARFLEGEGLRWLEVFRRPDGWYATALLRDGGRRVYALRDGRPAPLAPGR